MSGRFYQSLNSERSDFRFEVWKPTNKEFAELFEISPVDNDRVVDFKRSLQSSSKYLLWTVSGRFYKEFAELIKISSVDSVRAVL